MLSKIGAILGTVLLISANILPVSALTELERATIADPRLENAFGVHITDNVNVNQQVQISAGITNHQEKSQTFVYIVQIKDDEGYIVSLGWISGQLTPHQKLNPSLSWTPNESGEFTAEIFVWEGLINHNAISEYTTLQINII